MVDRTRHQDLFYLGDLGISLIGLGGIGAITAVTLAKMGVDNIKGIDDDVVSEENIATQLHKTGRVGYTKTNAVQELIFDFAGDVIFEGLRDRLGPDYPWKYIANEIVISAVDSIQSRKDIWAAIHDKPWVWYIDARMAAESLLIYTVDGKDSGWYDQMIAEQQDSNVPDLSCTAKATFFCACGAACVIGSFVRRIATGIRPPKVYSWNILEDNLIPIGGSNGRAA